MAKQTERARSLYGAAASSGGTGVLLPILLKAERLLGADLARKERALARTAPPAARILFWTASEAPTRVTPSMAHERSCA
jgi:hypothetical protein